MNTKSTFQVLVSLTGIGMLVIDFLLLIYFGHSRTHLITSFGIPALIFFMVYFGVLGINAKCFDPAFLKCDSVEIFQARLIKVGAIPIKLIALSVVLHAAFLSLVFFTGNFLDVEAGMKIPLFLAALSFGMLIGTMIYVICDGLVSKNLISNKIFEYPRTLREKRQAAKAWIIPIAAVVTAIAFTCGITMLAVDHDGTAKVIQFDVLLIPIFVFVMTISILALNLKKNSSRLFDIIIEELENLSSAHKNLSNRISVCSVDELGTIAGMVNDFSRHLGTGIRDIKDGQKELFVVGARMKENASSMADSISKISGGAEQVLVRTKGQMENTENTSREVKLISNQIKALEGSIFAQISSITQASAAVEEMVGNIDSIGSVTDRMAAQFKTVGDASDEGSRIQAESGIRIREIVEQSTALQDANRIIASIAANTNLLAMNAAIEAAHAGETGRGFAVVADEIRKLAVNSSDESQKISAELKMIVKTIDQIVKDAESSGRAFAEVSHRIDDTEKLVLEVNNAIHEQKTGAKEVIDALHSMNELSMKVKDGSKEMSQGSEVMVKEIGELKGSADEIESRMEEISNGINSLNSGAQEVSDMAETSKTSIQKISTIADSFEV